MTNWEYYELQIDYDGVFAIAYDAYRFNVNGEHDKICGSDYGKLIALLGEKGWELASSNYRQDGQRVHLFFKRPF